MIENHRALFLPTAAAALLAVALPGVARASEQPAKPLTTLADCIALALKQNPDVISADYEIDAAEAKAKQTRGNLGPRLRLEAGIQYWNKPLDISFASGSSGTTPSIASVAPGSDAEKINNQTLIPLLQMLGSLSQPTRAREQLTWSTGITLAQPLSTLWTIEEAYALNKLGVDVSRLERDRARRDVVYLVTEAYFRLVQLVSLEQVAAKSIEQISAQVQRAQSFLKNGMVGLNDVLRAELGLAAAQQRLITVRGNIVLARGRLATLMGLGPDAPITPTEVVTQPPAAPEFTAQAAQEMALKERLEFQEVATRLDMARHGVTLAKSKMIPSLNLVGNYTHSEGSKFQQTDAAFIGGSLSWDVWEWGATYFGISEAKTRVKQALTARSKIEDLIRLEVNGAYVTVTTAAQALEVARKAVAQAEENFRIEQKRYEAANNTSFDVLDAETQLTNARLQAEAALYDYVIAESNLRKAIGRMPEQAKVKS